VHNASGEKCSAIATKTVGWKYVIRAPSQTRGHADCSIRGRSVGATCPEPAIVRVKLNGPMAGSLSGWVNSPVAYVCSPHVSTDASLFDAQQVQKRVPVISRAVRCDDAQPQRQLGDCKRQLVPQVCANAECAARTAVQDIKFMLSIGYGNPAVQSRHEDHTAPETDGVRVQRWECALNSTAELCLPGTGS
jgi:hypothetical protein